MATFLGNIILENVASPENVADTDPTGNVATSPENVAAVDPTGNVATSPGSVAGLKMSMLLRRLNYTCSSEQASYCFHSLDDYIITAAQIATPD